MEKTYPIIPVAKPRMTQRDKWKQRPVVLKYRAFKDACRDYGVTIPICGAHVILRIPMPHSWSKKKRAAMNNTPHLQRPDVDNYLKAILDSVFEEDSSVWDIHITKIWSEVPAIVVTDCEGTL